MEAAKAGNCGKHRGTFNPITMLGILARSKAGRYGVALLFVALALLSSLMLQRFFPYPFLFLFFAAVMAGAWFGGIGPGLFGVVLSTIAAEYFLVPPFDSLKINATDTTYFASFVICSLAASWVSSSKKKDQEALDEARGHLEVRVADRTAELQRTNTALQNSIYQREKAQQALIETQAKLAEVTRLLTIGELTASIAHEVNQPLTAVVTYGRACLEWLSKNPPDLDEARRAAETVIQDGTRAGAIINRIRALFRRQSPEKEWLDLNEVIRHLMDLVQNESFKHGVFITSELAPDLPKIKGDRVQLEQVLLNLVMNSIDAMNGITDRKKEVVITSSRESLSELIVSVEDCGQGISPEIAEKIFRPFFTTKPQGIGMGLSIRRSIVESHGGRISVTSQLGHGSVFYFSLPVG